MASLISSDFSIETDISNNPMISPQESIVPFWGDNPNVLLQGKYIGELFPIGDMTFNQKLNAISRTILILTIVIFILNRTFRIVLVGGLTLGVIFMLHHYKRKEYEKKRGEKEGFENPALAVLNQFSSNMPTDSTSKGNSLDTANTFDAPTDTNPFSNVLLPDYEYNPQKKPAPPAFNVNVNNEILSQAKRLVVDQNPGQPDIADKLFTDLGEQFIFEQSLQPFYSNPATTIPNDQAGFADFCYGSMVSCKEGNLFACARNLDRYTN